MHSRVNDLVVLSNFKLPRSIDIKSLMLLFTLRLEVYDSIDWIIIFLRVLLHDGILSYRASYVRISLEIRLLPCGIRSSVYLHRAIHHVSYTLDHNDFQMIIHLTILLLFERSVNELTVHLALNDLPINITM